ncbi:MAG: rhamnulokinase, partial [Verrucomicrobiota bacterium]|nr:rhamnulokinase [Verrucomicrobiota bacterium]
MKRSYIACDLGAGSGRVMLAHLEDGKVALEEVYRFVSEPVRVFDSTRWNVLEIFRELKAGLKKVAERGVEVESVSVDSWGVDYVLLRDGTPQLAPPFHYRDARTDATFESAFDKVDRETIFAHSGIQFMSINTLYQLLSDVEKNAAVLEAAQCFLNIGDYFNYLFSGVARAEESLASTTQLYDPRTRQWSQELIGRFQLPTRIFPMIVPPGTKLGSLRPEIAAETGLHNTQVIATCSHDTGAAVAAVPASDGDDWAYLSSGTWSLLGVELHEPLLDARARECNFTNEAGYGGTTRFLKNIIGLWILQECRREWSEAGDPYTYEELLRMAKDALPLRSLINPNAPRFWKPGDMTRKIRTFCEETQQPVPETPGDILR